MGQRSKTIEGEIENAKVGRRELTIGLVPFLLVSLRFVCSCACNRLCLRLHVAPLQL